MIWHLDMTICWRFVGGCCEARVEELETRVRELEAEQELQELRAIVEAQEATKRSNQNITENIKKNLIYIYI